MKLLVAIAAVLALTAAVPQRRLQLKAEQNQQQLQQQPEQQQADDQHPAEQNYNNYSPQPNYRQQQAQQQEYNQQQQNQEQQQQEYRPQQQQQEYRAQQIKQQEYRQKQQVQDFRPKVELETTTFIPIISFDKQQGSDGSYKTSYETGNNIFANEEGHLKNVGEDHNALVQTGSYSYTAPDGQVISVEYTADELGFRVKGDHIPTPPPVSPEIQKGLDLIYAGIKANAERAAIEAKNNPEAARHQQDRDVLDYKGLYYQQ